ncbi:mpv17-like protein [Trichomycterus rosablanca]|uniref:mpv17-like protein n=1 Tax=Trichomycterus rosablanca TaxID=2290929 RepID=UPI002F356D1A
MNKIWTIFRSHPYISNVLGYTTLFASADLIQQGVLGGGPGSSTQLREDTSEQQTLVMSSDAGSDTQAQNSQCHIRKDSECSKYTSDEKDSLLTVKNFPMHNFDWGQTARIALIGLCFHSNFNYHWLRALERLFPGGGTKRISMKVFLDQLVAAPATISAFYIGLSTLEGKEDPFEDWRNKFWTSYKTGIVYWSIMQAVNFSLVPPVARTVYVGGISLSWTVFLCHFRQQRN